MSEGEVIRDVLFALLVGAALPLMAQAFVTLRGISRVAHTAERRLDEIGAALSDLGAGLRRGRSSGVDAAALLGALLPAALAAVKAFRGRAADPDQEPSSLDAGADAGHATPPA